MSQNKLLRFGIYSPFVFWVTTVVCGLMIDDYNHFNDLVSALGALGTPTQYIFTVGLVLSAIFNLFFIVGLWQFCKTYSLSVVPIFFLALYTFIAGPAIFPMPLSLHGIVGIPFPFLILSPLLSLFFWWNKESFLKIRIMAIVSFLIMIFGFLIFFPEILNAYFGLKQRFLYAGWTVWSISLWYRTLRVQMHQETNS